MTEAAAVEALRARLTAAQSALAEARGRAELAADSLVKAPTISAVEVRDRTRQEAEVCELEVERLKRDLLETEKAAHADAIDELGAKHGTASVEVQELWDAIEGAVGVMEAKIGRVTVLRREASRRTAKAREHHALAGGSEETRPSFTMSLPRTNQVRERLTKVIRALQKAEVPQWW